MELCSSTSNKSSKIWRKEECESKVSVPVTEGSVVSRSQEGEKKKVDRKNLIGLAILVAVLGAFAAISASLAEACGYAGCEQGVGPFVYVDNASTEWRKNHPEAIKAHVYPDGYLHELENLGAASPRQDTNYAVGRSVVGKKGDMILIRAGTNALYFDDPSSNWPTRTVGPGTKPGCWVWKVTAEKVLIQGNTDQNGGVVTPSTWDLGNLEPCGYPAEYPPKGHPTWIVTRGYGEATVQYDCYDEDYCPRRRPAPCGYPGPGYNPKCGVPFPTPAPSYPPAPQPGAPTYSPDGAYCPQTQTEAASNLGGNYWHWSYIGTASGYPKWFFDAGFNNPHWLNWPGSGSFDTWKHGNFVRRDVYIESATYNCTNRTW